MTTFDAETPPTLRPLQVKAPDIEQWLLARDPKAINSYRDLAPEEYARAFTAARTAGTDVIDDIYYAMADNISRSGSEADFQRMVIPTLKAKGWLGGDDGKIATRVALIYDTNLRLARGAGRWDRYQRTKAAFPYLEAFTAEDERVRHPPHSKSDHRAFDGIRLPIDHPFWQRWSFPAGFRCRCSYRQLSRSGLARTTGITSEAELAEREARLGEPVFASPAMPIQTQLSSMVQATNDERMPGLPPVEPRDTEQRGREMYRQALAAQAVDAIGEALAKLLGL